VTGNTVVDALLAVNAIIESDATIRHSLDAEFAFLHPHRNLILVTGHRRENLDHGLSDICDCLIELSRRPDVEIVYPVHLNPKVQEIVARRLVGIDRLHLLKPVGYLQFVYLMRRASLLLTDSGGIQEEAPSLGKPVLITRDVTERPEALVSGTARLIGTSPECVLAEVSRCLDDPQLKREAVVHPNPFGDGRAAQRIVAELCSNQQLRPIATTQPTMPLSAALQ
jgi:UDP-N-acetylglucosamine 2-epimerase (non-hydrolysing)